MNIYEKLIEVRKEVPYLKKDNSGYQFKFVSSSQTLGTLKGKMDELGLLLVPSVTYSKVSDHTTKKGDHEYFTQVEMTFTWINAEKPEEMIQCQWLGQGLDNGEKGVGKALTYAEKYFLLKFFNIATDSDDPDKFQDKIESGKVEDKVDWVDLLEKEADENCKTVDELGNWYKLKKAQIAKLSKADQKTINSYVTQLKESITIPEETNG